MAFVDEEPTREDRADAAERGLLLAEMAVDGRPTRADDTVVIDGHRATLDEVLAYIAADAASRSGG